MKTIASLLIIIAPSCLYCQRTENSDLNRNVLKIAPQQFGINSLKVGIEHFNKSHNKSYSLFITAREEKNNQTVYPTGLSGLGGEVQYRTYLKPLKHYTNQNNKGFDQGIYLGGYIQGQSFSRDQIFRYTQIDPATSQPLTAEVVAHESLGSWGTGFTIGVQRVFWKVLSLDLYVGGGIQWSDTIRDGFVPPTFFPSPNAYYDPGFQGILPKIGAHLGVIL